MAVIKLIDSYTNEQVEYFPVAAWIDGTPMTDANCDGVVYRKMGTTYYKRAFTGSISVSWFGAKGDGITDDTVAIRNALNVCNNLGADLKLKYMGVHLMTSNITINTYNKANFKFDLNKSTILQKNCTLTFTVNNNVPFFSTTLARELTKGDTYILCTNITGVNVGDLIEINSPAITSGGIQHLQYYTISYIDTTAGNKLYVENLVVSDCTNQQIIDDGVTGSIVVNFYKLSNNLHITNGTINSDKVADCCLMIQNQNKLLIDNLTFLNASRYGVYVQYSGNSVLNNCESYYHGYATKDRGYVSLPTDPGGLAFGYGFTHARNSYSEVNNCRGGNGWHTFECARGQSIINYNNCQTTKDAYGFSTHEGAWVVNYFNCTAFGGGGITCRAVYVSVLGGYFKPSNTGHAIAGSGYNEVELLIEGCLIDMRGNPAGSYLSAPAIFTTVIGHGALSVGTVQKVVFNRNTVLSATFGAFKTMGNVIFKNNFIDGQSSNNFYGQSVIVGENHFTGIGNQSLLNLDGTLLQFLSVKYNIVTGLIQTPSNSAFIYISNTLVTGNKIYIDNNILNSPAYFLRFLNSGSAGNIITMNGNANATQLINADSSNVIITAINNIITQPVSNSVIGGIALPTNVLNSYGITSQRPTSPTIGTIFFDTTLGKPVFWNGTAWIDAETAATTTIKGIVNKSAALTNSTPTITPATSGAAPASYTQSFEAALVTDIANLITEVTALKTRYEELITKQQAAGQQS